jgi:hypothetical protein
MSGARPSSRCHLSEDFLLLQSSCRSPFLGHSPTMPKVSELERSRHVRTVCASVSSSTTGKESDSTSMWGNDTKVSELSGSRETQTGQFKAFSVNLRRLSGRKTPAEGIWSWFQGEERALYCLISIAKQSFSVHCHLRHLRELKLLSARASPQPSRAGQFAHFRVVTPRPSKS